MESNDSSEIPDRGETSDIPGLPSRGYNSIKRKEKTDMFQMKGSIKKNNLKDRKKKMKTNF